MLLEVDADAAEQHAIPADVVLVGRRRRVEREERDLMAAREQLDRQSVVAGAASAIHARSARCDRQDLHVASGSGLSAAPSTQHFIWTSQSSAVWNARARNRKSMRLPSWGCSQFS